MHYHDKKTEYTAPSSYRDLDGQMRTFTYVDHDKKTKINIPSSTGNPKQELKEYRKSLIEKILSYPAAFCPEIFSDFKLRGESYDRIEWNENMLNDEGTPLQQLSDIYTLTSKQVNPL